MQKTFSTVTLSCPTIWETLSSGKLSVTPNEQPRGFSRGQLDLIQMGTGRHMSMVPSTLCQKGTEHHGQAPTVGILFMELTY